jgi:hypothetical protein
VKGRAAGMAAYKLRPTRVPQRINLVDSHHAPATTDPNLSNCVSLGIRDDSMRWTRAEDTTMRVDSLPHLSVSQHFGTVPNAATNRKTRAVHCRDRPRLRNCDWCIKLRMSVLSSFPERKRAMTPTNAVEEPIDKKTGIMQEQENGNGSRQPAKPLTETAQDEFELRRRLFFAP